MPGELRPLIAGLAASVVAGPAFVAVYTLMEILAQTGQPLFVTNLLSGSGLMLVIALGFVVAFLPAYLGSWMKAAFCGVWDAARAPWAWALCGALLLVPLVPIGNGVPNLVDLIPFPGTGALCALICWRIVVPGVEPADQA